MDANYINLVSKVAAGIYVISSLPKRNETLHLSYGTRLILTMVNLQTAACRYFHVKLQHKQRM